MIEHFWNDDEKSFFFTVDNHESLIVRPKNYYDLSVPSGNSVASNALLKLHHLTHQEKFLKISEKILDKPIPYMPICISSFIFLSLNMLLPVL